MAGVQTLIYSLLLNFYNALPLLPDKVKVKIIGAVKSSVQHYCLFERFEYLLSTPQRYVFFLTVVYFSTRNRQEIPLKVLF
jgi:hypothetical protein